MNNQISTRIETTLKNVKMESSSAIQSSLVHPWHPKHGHRQLNSGDAQTFRKFGPNSGREEFAEHLAILANATLTESKNVLHGHDVAFHTRDFSNTDHLARSIAEAADLNDQVDRGGDLAPNRSIRDAQIRHGYHRFQTAQRIAG